MSNRIENPSQISMNAIHAAIEATGTCAVQFSDPVACSPDLLNMLNAACRINDHRLQVRFYDFFGTPFDATLLRYLPDVKSLSLDHLSDVIHAECISDLENLSALHLSIEGNVDIAFVEMLQLEYMKELTLGQFGRQTLGLSFLKRSLALTTLRIIGHTSEIDVIAELPRLKSLSLVSLPKAVSLSFVSNVSNLHELSILLGGRTSIDEVEGEHIQSLQVRRVRGLSEIGTLTRFPNLKSLWLEDLARLEAINLNGPMLAELTMRNCRALTGINGLAQQTELRTFEASRLAVDLEEYLDFSWSSSMRQVRLVSDSERWNLRAEHILDARGLNQGIPD